MQVRPLWLIALLAASVGCDSLSEYNDVYSVGADHRVLCGYSLDDKNSVSVDALSSAFERARARRETVHLYAHKPSGTVQSSTIESAVAGASDRGLGFVTYRELAMGVVPTKGSLALSFDDHAVSEWRAMLPMFAQYHARVTFFVSSFQFGTPEDRAMLHELAAAGHDIEYHSTNHFNAEQYSTANGVERYIADDIDPGLAAMRADGFDPVVFAYPFGARTEATDAALLTKFTLLRAIHYSCPR
jgi:peptidoglycan/xylan/chitin deacetylase (PgdA/CDA1 family)